MKTISLINCGNAIHLKVPVGIEMVTTGSNVIPVNCESCKVVVSVAELVTGTRRQPGVNPIFPSSFRAQKCNDADRLQRTPSLSVRERLPGVLPSKTAPCCRWDISPKIQS